MLIQETGLVDRREARQRRVLLDARCAVGRRLREDSQVMKNALRLTFLSCSSLLLTLNCSNLAIFHTTVQNSVVNADLWIQEAQRKPVLTSLVVFRAS